MNPSGAGRGNYGWAAQRLSRATALAAVHWQNPRVWALYGEDGGGAWVKRVKSKTELQMLLLLPVMWMLDLLLDNLLRLLNSFSTITLTTYMDDSLVDDLLRLLDSFVTLPILESFGMFRFCASSMVESLPGVSRPIAWIPRS